MKMEHTWLLYFLVLYMAVMPAMGKFEEQALVKRLLKEYEKVGGKLARPVPLVNDTLTVDMRMALVRAELDETTGILTAKVWMQYTWKDALLTWDREEDDISMIRMETENMWMPDVIMYNSIGRVVPDVDALALVMSDGTIWYIPPITMTTKCDGYNDTYYCRFKFGSWAYDGFQLDVNLYDDMSEIDLNEYVMSNTWEVTKTAAVKNVKYYPCCTEPYPDITFSLEFTKMANKK